MVATKHFPLRIEMGVLFFSSQCLNGTVKCIEATTENTGNLQSFFHITVAQRKFLTLNSNLVFSSYVFSL